MHRWAALPEADRAAVLLDARTATEGRLVVSEEIGAERAARLASALGSSAREAEFRALLEFVRDTVSREFPDFRLLSEAPERASPKRRCSNAVSEPSKVAGRCSDSG